MTKKAFELSEKALQSMIDEVITGRNDLQKKLSMTATNCVLFCIAHSQYTPMERLLVGLGAKSKGKQATEIRVNELRDWFLKFAPVTKSTEEGKFFAFSAEKLAKLKPAFEADWMAVAKELNEKPFWVDKPAPDFQGMDLSKWLLAGFNRVGKIESDPEKAKHKDNKGFQYKALLKQLADAIHRGDHVELQVSAKH